MKWNRNKSLGRVAHTNKFLDALEKGSITRRKPKEEMGTNTQEIRSYQDFTRNGKRDTGDRVGKEGLTSYDTSYTTRLTKLGVLVKTTEESIPD